MVRSKVKLAYVTDSVARKATYKKRKIGILKKVSQLSILCGIDACAIIYSPFDTQPEVWPNPSEVQKLTERFRNWPETEKGKKMLSQETFVKQRICKLKEKLNKKCKENREKEMTDFMSKSLADKSWLAYLMPEDKVSLEWFIDEKLKEVIKRTEALKRDASYQHQVAPAPEAPPAPHPAMEDTFSEMKPTVGINVVSPVSTPWLDQINPIENMGFGIQDVEVENMMPFNGNQDSIWADAFCLKD